MGFQRTVILRFCLLLAIFCLCACGRKLPPELPERRAPKPVSDLRVIGSVGGVVFEFEAPTKNARGDRLKDLSGYVVQRRRLGSHASSSSFKTIAKLTLSAEQKEKLEFPKEESLKHRIIDEKVEAGVEYEYIVLAENDRGVRGEADFVFRVNFVGENSLVQKTPVVTLY